MACAGDLEREKRIAKSELKFRSLRKELKKKIKDLNNSAQDRVQYMIELDKLPRDSSLIRKRNRCAVTGRSRSYMRKFGLSRHVFRELASQGYLPGVIKASW